MRDWILTLLRSRGFWTGLGPVIIAVHHLFGVTFSDSKVAALGVILSAIGGWATVTVVRKVKGEPTSYDKK